MPRWASRSRWNSRPPSTTACPRGRGRRSYCWAWDSTRSRGTRGSRSRTSRSCCRRSPPRTPWARTTTRTSRRTRQTTCRGGTQGTWSLTAAQGPPRQSTCREISCCTARRRRAGTAPRGSSRTPRPGTASTRCCPRRTSSSWPHTARRRSGRRWGCTCCMGTACTCSRPRPSSAPKHTTCKLRCGTRSTGPRRTWSTRTRPRPSSPQRTWCTPRRTSRQRRRCRSPLGTVGGGGADTVEGVARSALSRPQLHGGPR